jgi:hypothetical protein
MSEGNFYVKKLITKEDPIHLHKVLGVIALANYIYRYYLLLVYGSMFINTTADIALIGAHGLLSVSSLIFHIPAKRHAKMPMIYPEFRLHSIAFAMRCVICCFIEFYAPKKYSLFLKMATCIGTMLVADQITNVYAEPGDTTMRAMPFSEVTDETSKQKITKFHSAQQVCATIAMLLNMDSAFAPMFAIQFAAFLMTLVRKNIIKPNTWHLLYSWSLMINVFLYFTMTIKHAIVMATSTYLFRYLRFTNKMNKYIAWIIIFIYIYFINSFPNLETITPNCVSWAIVIYYLTKNIYNSRALYLR